MVEKIIIKALQKVTGSKDIKIDHPNDASHGDYATNVALVESKQQKINPVMLAEEFAMGLRKDEELKKVISKIDVVKPGFINFFLSQDYLISNLNEILEKEGEYGNGSEGKGKTVVIDYSSPNIAKRFGIGHLRSTIIGQALYNIYKSQGWKVIGDNHLGDWGTQFGVLIYMVQKNNLDVNTLSVEDFEKLYVDFHSQLESNPDLKDESRKAFKRLEEGDKDAKKIWQAAYDVSIKEYNKIYKKLGVEIDYAYGESFYSDKMDSAIETAKEKGVAIKSEGAIAVEFEKYNLPSSLLVKSNGTTTYLTRDLALMFYRKSEWKPDLQIFEVGADQTLYFKQVFALAEMMGLFKLSQLKHIAHGMIRFKDGKMSTRKGKTINLEDVIDQAVKRASELGSSKDLAEKVGIGALKWNDLKRSPQTDIVFDWDEILNMNGNSGPYLQYTFARTQSVAKKSKKSTGSKYKVPSKMGSLEIELMRKLSQFPGVLTYVVKNYSPNALTNYLFELAQSYNHFYAKDKIVGSEEEEFRLALNNSVGIVIKNGLRLLGIEAPEKM